MSEQATGAMNTPANSNNEFADERVICEYWPSYGGSNAVNKFAAGLPFGLGAFPYFLWYVLKVANIWKHQRYTLTNKRLRVDEGVKKRTIDFVRLDDIEDLEVKDYVPFTRTGDVIIKTAHNTVRLGMHGIQDPEPAMKTIRDAVTAKKKVDEVLRRQEQAKAQAVAT